jgi:CubicO group peptidase (beta-lactamase class C family)
MIELTAKPGDRFSYSNVGMAILGHLVERASAPRPARRPVDGVDGAAQGGAGQPYEDVIRARILDPLGMRHTRVTPLPGEPEPLFHAPTGPFAAAGGFHSTLDDLILFARVLLRVPHRPTSDPLSRPAGEGGVVVRGATPVARVLSPFQSLNAALSFTFLRRGHDTTGRPLYLGWHEDKAGRLMHSGLWHAYLGLDRKKSFALVMLLTGQTSVNDALGSAAMACVAGEEASFPARPRT